jgi:hypothetical protein
MIRTLRFARTSIQHLRQCRQVLYQQFKVLCNENRLLLLVSRLTRCRISVCCRSGTSQRGAKIDGAKEIEVAHDTHTPTHTQHTQHTHTHGHDLLLTNILDYFVFLKNRLGYIFYSIQTILYYSYSYSYLHIYVLHALHSLSLSHTHKHTHMLHT